MPSKSLRISDKAHLPFKTTNKIHRQNLHIKQKTARDKLRRADRFSRKKEEDRDPRLKEERLRRNVPQTLDRKRKWDEVDGDLEDGGLGQVVDVEQLQRRKLAEEQELGHAGNASDASQAASSDDEDHDSMLDEDEENDPVEPSINTTAPPAPTDPLPTSTQLELQLPRSTSPTRSTTSTNLALVPEALASKFPSLFPTSHTLTPKILITTSFNSTLHDEAHTLTTLFPNSTYIPRSAHRYAHKFSVREISSFAAARSYTSVLVLEETTKKPTGLTIVHLPSGPTFHFSIQTWHATSLIPHHGRATNHTPELILNNFRTPLGILTAHLFRSLFPVTPDLEGRQVLTIHNQRDFIFLRKHRYIFRDKRDTERAVTDPETGTEVKGLQSIRAGLQELGPRLTLKLRRVDHGIQRRSGTEWEWKGKTDRVRTRFQL